MFQHGRGAELIRSLAGIDLALDRLMHASGVSYRTRSEEAKMKLLTRGVAALITITALACGGSPTEPSKTPPTKPTFQAAAPQRTGLAPNGLTGR